MKAPVSKEKCCGCYACYNACATGALQMDVDETGFWFPKINSNLCIKCGACAEVCPARKRRLVTACVPKAFIAQSRNDTVRRESTSGGAFTEIAKRVIELDGVVFGAAIDERFWVSHICVDHEKDLARFRNSKYVQSAIGLAYREVKAELKKNKYVCFSGTPCQIYGLKNYLAKEYEKLLTVDVMCRAVPSPKVLQKYLDYQREKYPRFDKLYFRDKGRGYSYSCITLFEGERVLYRGGSESDPWLRLFLGGYCNRESCHDCPYQNGARAADITLYDCWNTQEYAPEWDDNKGTTNVIAWTEKGEAYLQSVKATLRIKEIKLDHVSVNLNRTSLHMPQYDRQKFFADCEEMTAHSFISKYAPMNVCIRVKQMIRLLMYYTHLHNVARKAVHALRRRKKMKN